MPAAYEWMNRFPEVAETSPDLRRAVLGKIPPGVFRAEINLQDGVEQLKPILELNHNPRHPTVNRLKGFAEVVTCHANTGTSRTHGTCTITCRTSKRSKRIWSITGPSGSSRGSFTCCRAISSRSTICSSCPAP